MTAEGKVVHQAQGSGSGGWDVQDVLNDVMPDLMALELAYGGGGRAKKAVVKPKVVPAALPEPEEAVPTAVAVETPSALPATWAASSSKPCGRPGGAALPGAGLAIREDDAAGEGPPRREGPTADARLPWRWEDMLQQAEKLLDFNLLELCLKGPESELEPLAVPPGLDVAFYRRTKFCQPVMYVAGLAGMEKLRAEKPEKAPKREL